MLPWAPDPDPPPWEGPAWSNAERVVQWRRRMCGATINYRRGCFARFRPSSCVFLPPRAAHQPRLHEQPPVPALANTTNIHTHGLFVSPEDPADNILRATGPGQTRTYEYDIIPDHPSGMFWYHPHAHSASALQTGGGMAGVIIVEDDPATMPAALAAIAPQGIADQVVLVFQTFNLQSYRQSSVPWRQQETLRETCGDNLKIEWDPSRPVAAVPLVLQTCRLHVKQRTLIPNRLRLASWAACFGRS